MDEEEPVELHMTRPVATDTPAEESFSDEQQQEQQMAVNAKVMSSESVMVRMVMIVQQMICDLQPLLESRNSQ